MRRKAREMETLVSLIQRAWSQLDIDASLILDSLGDSEVMIPDAGSTELLYRMLHISDKFTMLDPTSTDNIPKLETDQWSSTKDIEKAKATAEEQLSELPNISPEPSDISKPSQESANEDEMMEIGPEIEQHLAGHVQFTLSLLERVCNAINESGVFSSNQEILKSLAQTKESHAKIMFLNDSVAKLRSEIIQLESKLQLAENDKIKVEKKLDKALHSVKELEENGVKSVRKTTEVVVGEDGNSVVPTTEEDNENALESQIKELQLQIRLLEKQLVDSESAKAKVEMTLTERLSRPLPQIETQVADMRKAMEELRQQCKQRVNSMIIEHGAMHEREKDLTLALRQVEASVGEKIEEVVNLTKMKIQSINEEKLGLEAKLSTLKADFEIVDQLKAQLQEYQTLDESRNSKIKNLETQLKSNNDRMNTLEKHLKDSRKRELSLEQAIVSYEIPVPEHLRPKAAITEDGEISGGGSIDILTQQLIKQAHDRTAALEQELLEMKNSVNDLIMEIESVTTEESNARAQSERLLKQIQDCQSLQRAALEENLKLQNQLEELHKSTKEMEVK